MKITRTAVLLLLGILLVSGFACGGNGEPDTLDMGVWGCAACGGCSSESSSTPPATLAESLQTVKAMVWILNHASEECPVPYGDYIVDLYLDDIEIAHKVVTWTLLELEQKVKKEVVFTNLNATSVSKVRLEMPARHTD